MDGGAWRNIVLSRVCKESDMTEATWHNIQTLLSDLNLDSRIWLNNKPYLRIYFYSLSKYCMYIVPKHEIIL